MSYSANYEWISIKYCVGMILSTLGVCNSFRYITSWWWQNEGVSSVCLVIDIISHTIHSILEIRTTPCLYHISLPLYNNFISIILSFIHLSKCGVHKLNINGKLWQLPKWLGIKHERYKQMSKYHCSIMFQKFKFFFTCRPPRLPTSSQPNPDCKL